MNQIPSEFYSDIDNKPFKECKVCSVAINTGEEPYAIEKAFKKTAEGEDLTLFELVICMDCAQDQAEKMSKESRAFINGMMMNDSILQKKSRSFRKQLARQLEK